MDFLGRNGAPLSNELWQKIDSTVVSMAKKILTARRFLPFAEPAGPAKQFAVIDRYNKTEENADWYIKTSNRLVVEIPELFVDFSLNWRDLEANMNDMSKVVQAAQILANREDEMVYYGIPALGLEGILTVKGACNVKKSDWGSGEGSFTDVAAAMDLLEKNNRIGKYYLVMSNDMYMKLQRIQPGTGMLEADRICRLIDGRIIKSTVLKPGTAFMVCAEPYCMDLLVGQDITTAYLESVNLNHNLRIMETALLRIKCPDAIVIFK